MSLGMCIGVFDEKIGPTSIYQLNLSEELSKNIVMKVMVGVMSFTSDTDENSLRGESIIPFLKEKIITFAYLFPLKDTKARGGFRQCSIVIAFNIKDRKNLYENATNLARYVKTMSESIELKHIQEKKIPLSISEKYNTMRSIVFTEITKGTNAKSKIKIVCPQCSKSSEIELPTVTRGVKLIEHQIYEKEICEHSFTVYLDSKFNILGYKDPEIELNEMKNIFGKLKSPYD
ncbi:MAG: hypothetical protein FK733_15765 [Asgard group archaeon]|nr:hypothetical protein [Asgard group archaeon]